MITLMLFAAATVGLTNILVHGSIFDLVQIRKKSLRDWAKKFMGRAYQVFECYECTGFWAGLVCGAMIVSLEWWLILACGFAGSVICQTYTDAMYLLRSKVEFVVEDKDAQSSE